MPRTPGPIRARSASWLRVPVAVVALLSVLLSALAVFHEGLPTAQVDVNDGGIWVTSGQRQLVGHLNYESRTLEGAFRTTSQRFDVGQAGDTVTFTDLAVNSVVPVDVAQIRLGAATSLTEGTLAVQGGRRLAVLDPVQGNLWVADASAPAATDYSEGTALATDLEGGAVTAALDGTVLAASARSAKLVSLSPRGQTDTLATAAITGLPATAQLTITAVGAKPVAFDTRSNTIVLPDGSTRSLSESGVPLGGVLQQPGPDADHVLLATPTSLVAIGLSPFSVTQLPAAEQAPVPGAPAAPVRLEGCEYAAWSGSGSYLRRCDGSDDIVRLQVDSLARAGSVTFRTNRTLIVLNDIGSGSVWLPEKNMVLATGWDQIEQQLKENDNSEESPQTTERIADPERRQRNSPPIAADDEFGVRPGVSTTLDVLGNDSDPDGDVLTAAVLSKPKVGTLGRTRGGQALRLDVPADATGTTTFGYQASDGRAVDTANVTVNVHPYSVNAGPDQRRDPGVKVGRNAEVEYNLLPDWRDPDGDPIFLESVSAPANVQVQFREEGTVSIKDLGAKPGALVLKVRVSDGAKSSEGQLTLQIQQPGNLPPSANGDFYVVRAGEPATIEPLANDTDPNGDTLSLAAVSAAPAGTTVVPDLDLGTLTFTARTMGSYLLAYTVRDGPSTALGVVRVDVVGVDQASAPVAENDLALLPGGGAALVAPLNNDTDPGGRVLVIQSVDAPPGGNVKVTLIDHHLVRVTAQRQITEPVTLGYTISNGVRTAKGKILVVPTRANDAKTPPQLHDDRSKVRVGDIESVQVLNNDRSPAGLPLRLDPRLEYTANPEVGTPFVTGNLVRLAAGTKPGFVHAAYTVRDSSGAMATATVLFEVVALDAANDAPRPKVLTAWAVSGQTTRIPVPLAGIDPDGDSTILAGVEQPATMGTVVLGTDWLEYTPAPNATGTDVFTYLVEDRQGKQASARVRVGIAPPSKVNQDPTAIPDTLFVRPNRVLTVPVTGNDIDPDADVISLDPNGLQSLDPRIKPTVVGSSISVRTPEEQGAYPVAYTITDGRGGSSTGVLTLNVHPEAPLLPPVARDDVVALADVPADGSAVTVDVLVNDEDPDGDSATLKLASGSSGVTVKNGQLVITPDQRRRQVVYTITDQDGLAGTAVVSVPGTQRARPRLDERDPPLRVRGGQELTINLADVVITREGRTPRLTDPRTVTTPAGGEVAARDSAIIFKTAEDFAGDTSVSFEVSDGSAEDRSALTATLTIPITVLPSINHPPVITPTQLRVAAGEKLVVDLALMVRDPDDADPRGFTYTLVGAPAKLGAGLQGHTLTLQAAIAHAKGPTNPITIAVDDGSGPVTADVPVSVVASTRPLIQVTDALIEAANAGETTTVDLRKQTLNPFPETPIRILSSQFISGQGTIDPQGTVLAITPVKDFHGTMTVGYRLMDATNDPDRAVDGRIRLFVRARPEAPSEVTVTPTGAGSALVSFTPGSDNGAPITGFTLTDATTDKTYRCVVASCPVTGLSNGDKHAFFAVAHNDVGTSDPSPTSAAVLIDMRPGKPAPPTLTPGDETLSIDWSPPTNDGSAIQEYTLYLMGNSTQKIQVPGSQTSYRISGLNNGQSYRVSVQARNKAEEPGEVSEPSDAAIPFGAPSAPTSVSHANLPADDPSRAKVEITWAYPRDDNGRPWDQVRITSQAGVKLIDSDGSVTSAEIEVPPAEDTTVKVALHTEGGWSPDTAHSFQAVSAPVAIPAPTVEATGDDGEIAISGATTVAGNGYRRSQLDLQYNAGDGWQALSGNTMTGFANGVAVTLSFRQVSTAFRAPSYGPSVAAAPVTPYGPPIKPTLTASSGPGTVTFAWEAQPDNGGPKVTSVVLTVNGDRQTFSQLSGEATFPVSSGTLVKGTVTACDSEGPCTTSDEASGYPWGTMDVQPGNCSGGEQPASTDGTCSTFSVRPRNWSPKVPLSCTLNSDVNGTDYRFTVTSHTGWTESGLRTLLTDATAISARLSCRPS